MMKRSRVPRTLVFVKLARLHKFQNKNYLRAGKKSRGGGGNANYFLQQLFRTLLTGDVSFSINP